MLLREKRFGTDSYEQPCNYYGKRSRILYHDRRLLTVTLGIRLSLPPAKSSEKGLWALELKTKREPGVEVGMRNTWTRGISKETRQGCGEHPPSPVPFFSDRVREEKLVCKRSKTYVNRPSWPSPVPELSFLHAP